MALTVKIRGDATHLEKTMRSVQASVGGLASGLGKAAFAGAGFAAALAGIASAGAVISKLGEAVKDASGKAAGMESLTVQLQVLSGSAETAKNLIKQFREEAVKSPLNTTDYAQAAKLLMGYGVAAEETVPALKMLGDISLGNAERFGRLTLAYGQIITNGRLLADENNQLAESGFAPLQIIAQKTGETMAQLRKRMKDGGIGAAEVTAAMKTATSQGGRFFGAIDKGAATFEGKIAKLRDSVDSLQIAFGAGMNAGLKKALDATSATLPQLEAQFTQAGDFVGKAISDGVNGNLDLFIQAGLVAGEALKQGFMDVVGNLVTDAFRGAATGMGGLVGPNTEAASGFLANTIVGPKRTIGERAEDIKTSLAAPTRELQDTITRRDGERMIEELKRNRMATEELIRKGIKVTRESLAQEMYSR